LRIVRLVMTLGAGVWASFLYGVLRLLCCRRPDAVLFTLIGLASSAALFWTSIPETYVFGSISILAALAVTALAERRPIPAWLDVAAAAAALSMTVTNWMVALLSLFARHRAGAALQLAVNSFVVVVLLWGVQKYEVPSAVFFVGDKEEVKYMMRPEPATTLRVALLDSMVMPDIQTVDRRNESLWPKMTVQRSATWHLTSWGPVALIAWCALLACGLWAALTLQSLRKFRWVLLLSIAGQLTLHLIYGPETFLYTLHWLPLLVILAALATRTRLRVPVLALAGLLLVAAALHNYAELLHTVDLAVTHSG
jgi:hypothetical protein